MICAPVSIWPPASYCSPEHWDLAGTLNASLRAQGINLPASDLLIATVAHSVKMPLLAKDAHFETIRKRCLPEQKIISPSLP